jgi:hypothetical protein
MSRLDPAVQGRQDRDGAFRHHAGAGRSMLA